MKWHEATWSDINGHKMVLSDLKWQKVIKSDIKWQFYFIFIRTFVFILRHIMIWPFHFSSKKLYMNNLTIDRQTLGDATPCSGVTDYPEQSLNRLNWFLSLFPLEVHILIFEWLALVVFFFFSVHFLFLGIKVLG